MGRGASAAEGEEVNLPVEISRLGQAELDVARAWYENQRRGLGDEFIAEVEQDVTAIQEAPQRYPVYKNGVRRYVMKRFPYLIYYDIRPLKIRILRVAHSSRDPGPIQDLLP
jgi:toxin ParE1/3/4